MRREIQSSIRICDNCKKEQAQDHSKYVGNPFYGWLIIEKDRGVMSLINGIRYDFCSEECVVEYFSKKETDNG